MPTYKVELTRTAESDLALLHKSDRKLFEKVINKIQALPKNPKEGKPLTGKLSGVFSIRLNKYRILYQLDEQSNTLFILTLKHRKHAYARNI